LLELSTQHFRIPCVIFVDLMHCTVLKDPKPCLYRQTRITPAAFLHFLLLAESPLVARGLSVARGRIKVLTSHTN